MRAALGSIERLGQDRYRVSIEGGRTADGRRTRKSRVVRGSREAAEIELAKLKLEHGKADGCADGMTVDMAWHAYFEPTFDGRLAPSTAHKYRHEYAYNLQPRFGARIVGELTTRQIERALLDIPGEHPRDHSFRLFRTFYNYLWNHDLISENPFGKKMDIRAPRKHEQPVMGARQLAEWTRAMDGFRHEAVMLLYPYAGLRRGEGVGMRTEDIEFAERDGGTVALAHVRRNVDDDGHEHVMKTERSERTVVIAGWPAAQLRWLIDGMVPGWLAQEDDGRRTTPHTLSKRYKKWCGERGVPWYNIQQLRTTYATLSQASGVDATVTSRALGHTKLSMDYAHYFMANAPAQIAAAQALAASVGNTMYHAQNEKASTASG